MDLYYNDPESNRSDQYSKTVVDIKDESREKIIKHISKATKINRL